jgi:hypothetical protein
MHVACTQTLKAFNLPQYTSVGAPLLARTSIQALAMF